MKLRPQIYNMLTNEPYSIQEIDNARIEIHKMNDYPQIMESLGTQNFMLSVMCFSDVNNYKMLIEEGYYKELKLFYDEGTNKHWIEFWRQMEKIQGRNKGLLLVSFATLIIAFILSMIIDNATVSSAIMMSVLFLNFVALFGSRKYFKTKTSHLHLNTIDKIKEYVGGDEKFDELNEKHKVYTENYFGVNNESDNELDNEEKIEETTKEELLDNGNKE